MYCRAGDVVYNFTPLDHLRGVFPGEEGTYSTQRTAKGIIAKTLFTSKFENVKKELFLVQKKERLEIRFVPPERFPVSAGMTIYRDRIAIGSFTGKLFGVIIESQQMVDMMRVLFDLAWDSAEKH